MGGGGGQRRVDCKDHFASKNRHNQIRYYKQNRVLMHENPDPYRSLLRLRLKPLTDQAGLGFRHQSPLPGSLSAALALLPPVALGVLFPLGGAVPRPVHLPLPDGHARLQGVDGVGDRLERVAPVAGADGDDDGGLADRHHAQSEE